MTQKKFWLRKARSTQRIALMASPWECILRAIATGNFNLLSKNRFAVQCFHYWFYSSSSDNLINVVDVRRSKTRFSTTALQKSLFGWHAKTKGQPRVPIGAKMIAKCSRRLVTIITMDLPLIKFKDFLKTCRCL